MTEPIKDRSENGWVADAGAREELLAANDATIEEATEFADPMALRGLIYQLTGDPQLAQCGIELVDLHAASRSVLRSISSR